MSLPPNVCHYTETSESNKQDSKHQLSFSSSSSISSSSKSLFSSHNLKLNEKNHRDPNPTTNSLTDQNDDTFTESENESDNLVDI